MMVRCTLCMYQGGTCLYDYCEMRSRLDMHACMVMARHDCVHVFFLLTDMMIVHVNACLVN